MDNEMLQKEIEVLNTRIKHLEDLFYKDNFSGIYIERKDYSHIGNKLGFFSAVPITQPSSTGETTGASDITLNNATTFNGNYGTKAYTVLDLVKHLKTIGLLKKDN